MPSDVKERLKDYILSDMHDKIATENDVTSVDEDECMPPGTSPPGLTGQQRRKCLPAIVPGLLPTVTGPLLEGRSLSPGPGHGVSITFHNVRLHADRVFVQKREEITWKTDRTH